MSTMGRRLKLQLTADRLPMRQPFAISGYVFHEMPALVATVSDGEFMGRGEASGVYYLDDDVPKMTAAIEAIRGEVEAGLSRADLQRRLRRRAAPATPWIARSGNWKPRRPGARSWQLAGFTASRPLVTTMTAGAAAPAAMVEVVAGFPNPQAIKLKLTGEPDLDVARVDAVRAAANPLALASGWT